MKKIPGLRWWIIGLICLGTIINYLARNSLAVLAPELEKRLQFSDQQYSYIVLAFQPATPSCRRFAVSSSIFSDSSSGFLCSLWLGHFLLYCPLLPEAGLRWLSFAGY